WKQDVGPSNRQPPYQHQQQNPFVHERINKLEDTLEKFMHASMTNQKNTELQSEILKHRWDSWLNNYQINRQVIFQPTPKLIPKSIVIQLLPALVKLWEEGLEII
ncbi:hypothetical protein V8G54_022564, partial [Vigna mungo]